MTTSVKTARWLLLALLCASAQAAILPPTVGMGCATASIPLVADFGMGANYSATQAGSPTAVTLTVKRDGTWTVTFGGGDTPAGSPTSGTWTTSSSTAIGDEYQVLYTVSNQVNSPTVTNNASDWVLVNGDITLTIAKGAADASADVNARIRPTGCAAAELSETSNFAANGA